MKKKSALIFGLVLVILLSFGSGVVLGETTKDTPRLITVCETKIGGFLFGVSDGFSSLRSCPKNSRKVILGEEQKIKEDDRDKLGDVLFVSNFNVLKKNGEIWNYSPGDEGFFEWSYIGEIPEEVEILKILQWDENSFLTKDGDFYVRKQEVWEKISEIPADR